VIICYSQSSQPELCPSPPPSTAAGVLPAISSRRLSLLTLPHFAHVTPRRDRSVPSHRHKVMCAL
jgi:hypothetical protein